MTAEPTTTEQGRIASVASSLKERAGTAATALKDRAETAKKRRAENEDQINPVFALAFFTLAVVGAGKVVGLGIRGTRAGVRAVKARRA
jgi:hypothetical protein